MVRTLLLALVLLFCTAFRADAPAPAEYDALVVLHIDGLDDAMLGRLQTAVAKDPALTVEYSCVWGDAVVLHADGINFGEKADVITYVRRHLQQARIEAPVEFLYVHVEAKGTGKC